MDLRPRIKEKEIGNGFRHNAQTRIEDIYDTITNRTTSMLSPHDKFDPKHARKLRGSSLMGKTSLTPSPFDLSELSTFSSTTKRNNKPVFP